MAAAVAAAMMLRRQTGTSQHGGSVSGAKSARRGVRVKAAVAAAMMLRRQTGTSQHGGSVSGAKSARRGVRVNVVLNRPKTHPEKHVASMG
ncbi:hypothetical protein PZA20_22300 [Pectobacterium polaris]|uniref:hypothetical protein n=1 Tax=Pectobacterium polaris TaxID=2042057 RepID=UPI0023B1C83C|nr:hypothetical protein [Pectobacterium polaris]MDE8744535.1 hypothetical protein [Pectobacterium polaris]